MSKFDARWEACVARATYAGGRNEAVPFGFAARVLATVATQRSSKAVPLEIIWQRLTLRSLAWIGAFLLICAIMEVPHLRDRKVLEPGIENAVGQLVWSL